jgi:hypothetical protein
MKYNYTCLDHAEFQTSIAQLTAENSTHTHMKFLARNNLNNKILKYSHKVTDILHKLSQTGNFKFKSNSLWLL